MSSLIFPSPFGVYGRMKVAVVSVSDRFPIILVAGLNRVGGTIFYTVLVYFYNTEIGKNRC